MKLRVILHEILQLQIITFLTHCWCVKRQHLPYRPYLLRTSWRLRLQCTICRELCCIYFTDEFSASCLPIDKVLLTHVFAQCIPIVLNKRRRQVCVKCGQNISRIIRVLRQVATPFAFLILSFEFDFLQCTIFIYLYLLYRQEFSATGLPIDKVPLTQVCSMYPCLLCSNKRRRRLSRGIQN